LRLFLALAPTAAALGERLFDGALGAASGALLFGAPGFPSLAGDRLRGRPASPAALVSPRYSVTV